MSLRDRLIDYKVKNPNTWGTTIYDTDLKQDLLDYPEYVYLPLNQKAAAVILGYMPKCECGSDLEFQGKRKINLIHSTPFGGWLEFCSRSCMQKSKSTLDRRKQTMIDRYGTDSWAKSSEGKKVLSQKWDDQKKIDFKQKITKTYNEKYGVDHYSKTQEYLDKRSATILKNSNGKYTNTFQDVEKIKRTNIQKYGVDSWSKTTEGRLVLSSRNSMKNPEIARLSRVNRLLKTSNIDDEFKDILLNHPEQFKTYIDSLGLTFRKEIADHIGISQSWLNALFRACDMANEYLNHSHGSSYKEKELIDFINSLGIKFKLKDRTILEGKELDILIPESNLAIEFNGLYYHSEFTGGKDKYYHVDKTNLAESKGIQLLHIFEYEWDDQVKQNIWKSIIKSKLGLYDYRYYARKCKVIDIDAALARSFLEENHLAGFVGSSRHIGLFYDNELVSVMSIGKSRFNPIETEIHRYACRLNTQVIGGLSKLLSKVDRANLVSYADRRLAGADVSYSNFFINREVLGPTWWGFKQGTSDVKHRLSYTKQKLMTMFNYDDTKTAKENMFDNKYDLIWDCGNYKFS